MTRYNHSVLRGFHHVVPPFRDGSWHEAVAEEAHLISNWFSSWVVLGLGWFLQFGVPTTAAALELQKLKRRIREIREID